MPELVIIAGPNGSGKTTLTELGHLGDHGLSFPNHYINPDIIARDSGLDELEAWKYARGLRSQYRKNGVSFAFETVLSHPSTLLDI